MKRSLVRFSTFTHHSPDGDQGFPGNLEVAVTYSLAAEANDLRLDYEATTDRPTPINLTHHSYFNLRDFKLAIANQQTLIKTYPESPTVPDAMLNVASSQIEMGESIAEGTVSRWLKKVGDEVKRDEPIFEISTDKVDAEIPSPTAGVLAEIIVGEGKTVGVMTVVARIETEKGAAVAAAPAAPPPVAAAPAPVAATSAAPARFCKPRFHASPTCRMMPLLCRPPTRRAADDVRHSRTG